MDYSRIEITADVRHRPMKLWLSTPIGEYRFRKKIKIIGITNDSLSKKEYRPALPRSQ